jgi:hypothetical protein
LAGLNAPSGAAAAVQFAVVAHHPALTTADFMLV